MTHAGRTRGVEGSGAGTADAPASMLHQAFPRGFRLRPRRSTRRASPATPVQDRTARRERTVSGTPEGPGPTAGTPRHSAGPATTERHTAWPLAGTGGSEPYGYRAAFLAATLPMAVVDHEGLVVTANEALGVLLGRPAAALASQSAADLLDLAADGRTWHAYREVLHGRMLTVPPHPPAQAPRRAGTVGRGHRRADARAGGRRIRRRRAPPDAALRLGHQRPARVAETTAPPPDARPGDPAAQPDAVLRTALSRPGDPAVRRRRLRPRPGRALLPGSGRLQGRQRHDGPPDRRPAARRRRRPAHRLRGPGRPAP